MSHDVFISHSSLDKLAADAVCHGLEAKGIRCWIAPRDQVAGRAYGQQITSAIETAQVMVLVFSDHVNNSQAVLNEINIAAGANVTIVPFRLAKVKRQVQAIGSCGNLAAVVGRCHVQAHVQAPWKKLGFTCYWELNTSDPTSLFD